jgi:hypothetical protein
MREYHIPGGSIVTDAPANLRDDLLVAHDAIGRSKAEGTWRRYLPLWRKARQYMTAKLLGNGKAFNCANLRADQRYVLAAVTHKYRSDNTLTGTNMMCCAVKWAMKLNNIELDHEFHLNAIVQVARLERSGVVSKKKGITASHVRRVCDAWGNVDRLPYHAFSSAADKRGLRYLMMAAAIGVGFMTLCRFSDLATMCVGGIFWCEEGVQICLTIRKNNQQGTPEWHPIADSGRPNSVVAVLRRYVRSLGYVIPSLGCIDNRRSFLFRPVTYDSGHSHRSRQSPRLGDGRQMLRFAPSPDYNAFLGALRHALESCCGMSKQQAKAYGTQSLRSGGDTHLWRCGIPAEIRRELGRWATPSVEYGYLRLGVSERLALVQALDV